MLMLCTLRQNLLCACFEVEKYLEALVAFQNAVALDSKANDAYHGIGHIHYRVGYPTAAIAAYEQAISNDPHYVPAYYGMAVLHFSKTGEYELAIQALDRGLAANPGNAFLKANLGNVIARQGRIDEAIEILEEVVLNSPDNSFAVDFLSLLYLHQHRFDEAAEAARRGIELEDKTYLHLYLGYIYQAQGQLAEATGELERAVELDPEDYEARAALARVLRESGNLAASEEHYMLAEEMALRDDEYGQACFYAVSGETDRALELLEVSLAEGQVLSGWIRIDPEFAFIQDEPRFQALIGKPNLS